MRHVPKWNPINVCSYHLQEAGATPVQEIAYALATAIGVLDGVRDSGKIDPAELPAVVGRISFFVNAGVRFVEETCKMRAFTAMWDRICARALRRRRTPSSAASATACRSTRSGSPSSSPRTTCSGSCSRRSGVTLSKDARARAMQLPAWNEALGLPRPWDQQWSLRIQQILAFESDLLEYDDIFEGSTVIEAKTAELTEAAQAELDDVLALGGRLRGHRRAEDAAWCAARPSGCAASSRASSTVVGVNCFTETAPSPAHRRRRRSTTS